MTRNSIIALTLLVLSAIAPLRSAAYEAPDDSRFHASSVYYLSLQNASGTCINDIVAQTTGTIGAFVGGELRGISQYKLVSGSQTGSVLVLRVWGDDSDEAQVSFRMVSGDLEYELGTWDFGRGDDTTYGAASSPVTMTYKPVTGLLLTPTTISVALGGTNHVKAELDPKEHSTLLTELAYEYTSNNPSCFTVDSDGSIKGLAVGEGMLNVTAKTAEGKSVFTASAHVSVVLDQIAVTGIRNDMASLEIEKTVGDQFTLNFTVLPENATNRNVKYECPNPELIYSEINERTNQATFTALKDGETTITVTTVDGNFQLTYNITINKKVDPVIHVTEIKVSPSAVDVFVGDIINYSYTVLPENATDKTVTVTVSNPNGTEVLKKENDKITAIADGTATILITSNENPDIKGTITVKVSKIPDTVISFAQNEVTLSKLHDTELTLTANGTVVPSKMQILFSTAANGEPVATATMADNSGLKWTVRGQYAGNHTAKIRYNDKEQTSTCTLHIPAEYAIAKGWDWISLYAATDGSLVLKNNDKWVAPMQIDADNKVVEIRSQTELLYNDPELGFFGDIDHLSPAEGMYKVYSKYADANADKMVFNAGYNNLTFAAAMQQQQVREGYTWVTYPHEINHSLSALNSHLAKTASPGDLIIGRDFFAEFDSKEWIAPAAFRFEAGKGYIYYTTNTTRHTIDWGPATLTSDPANARQAGPSPAMMQEQVPVWSYNPYQYADGMAIVARLDGISDPENYSVGAFVGDECRGHGEAAPNGLIYIMVTGQRGDRLSFRLYNRATQQFSLLESKAIPFTGRAGSYASPVVLKTDATGIHDLAAANCGLTMSMSGGVITVGGTTGDPLVTIVDALGKTLLRQRGTQVALPRLGTGVYVITVTDGTAQVIKKLKK